MVGDANEAVDQFETLSTPSNLTDAASSCLSALKSRARALEAFRSSVAMLVTGSVTDQTGQARAGTAQAETSIEQIGPDLSGADESWSKCREAMLDAPGRGRNSVPPSVWVGAQTAWQAPSVVSFIDDLTQAAPTVAVEPLAIAAVSCDPPAVVTRGGIDDLPMATCCTCTWSCSTGTTQKSRESSRRCRSSPSVPRAIRTPPAPRRQSVRVRRSLSTCHLWR